jgi:hypothetical protein
MLICVNPENKYIFHANMKSVSAGLSRIFAKWMYHRRKAIVGFYRLISTSALTKFSDEEEVQYY